MSDTRPRRRHPRLGLAGPLNAGNGVIGGPAVPIIAWVVWILLVSLWWMRQARPGRAYSGY